MELQSIHSLLFSLGVLQRPRDVKRAHDICHGIVRNIDAWEAGQFTMLVEDTLRSMDEANQSLKQGNTSAKREPRPFIKRFWVAISEEPSDI
jgi:hypothetical protein